jgi:hypothetical protein
MIQSLKNTLLNIPGWRTHRKIIVFESDDWGSIRMSSKKAYDALLKKGYPVNYCAYSRNDALESNTDLQYLAEVLSEVKDFKGNPAVMTSNMLSANPDYDKIEKSNFEKYFWEPITKTYERYPEHDKVMALYQQGIKEKLFKPQLHGREHINVSRWFGALKNGEKRSRDAFEHRTLSLPLVKNTNGRRDFMDSFGLQDKETIQSYEDILKDAANVFKDLWGYRSLTFMAPCYTWHPDLEKTLKNIGVQGFQGTYVQRIPDNSKKIKVSRRYHFMGQKNKLDQYYFIRNAFFEPSECSDSQNLVDNTLNEIKKAFNYNKPAIVQSHRLNYIGSVNKNNRDVNLNLFRDLLKKLLELYPDVEFMSSDQLLDLVKK